MRGLLAVTVLALAAAGALAGAVPPKSPRQARWFLSWDNVTKVVEEVRTITQVTPWSCVVVAPSMPACRNVRQLSIAATPPTPIATTAAPALGAPGRYRDYNLAEASRRRYYLEQAMAPVGSLDAFHGDMVPVPNAPHGPPSGWVPLMAREATAPLPAAPPAPPATAPPAPAATSPPAPLPDKKREQGWAEWLGLRAYTVTSTVVNFTTIQVVDPDTVVTFSVRGCQPSKLPFDLPLCFAPQTQPEAVAPAVEVAPAAPAPSAAAPAEVPVAAPPAPAAAEPLEKTSMAPIVVAADPPAAAPTAPTAPESKAAPAPVPPAGPVAVAAPAKA